VQHIPDHRCQGRAANAHAIRDEFTRWFYPDPMFAQIFSD
jgi:hypothetical protein